MSPALGEEHATELIESGKSECLARYRGKGVNSRRVAEQIGIDLNEICDCDGRALTQMSERGQEVFVHNYTEFNKERHLAYSKGDLKKRAAYISRNCPEFFAFEAYFGKQVSKSYEGMWIRMTSPDGVTKTFVSRDGKLVRVPNSSE